MGRPACREGQDDECSPAHEPDRDRLGNPHQRAAGGTPAPAGDGRPPSTERPEARADSDPARAAADGRRPARADRPLRTSVMRAARARAETDKPRRPGEPQGRNRRVISVGRAHELGLGVGAVHQIRELPADIMPQRHEADRPCRIRRRPERTLGLDGLPLPDDAAAALVLAERSRVARDFSPAPFGSAPSGRSTARAAAATASAVNTPPDPGKHGR